MDRAQTNPILNTRMYKVEFAGGKVTELTYNIIVESMYTQCDAEGNEYLLLDLLVDHCNDNKAVSLTKQQICIQHRQITHKTTASWQICCQWKDCSTSWEKLSQLKESHPVQTVEFTALEGIDYNYLVG